jgi:hypothetical protein
MLILVYVRNHVLRSCIPSSYLTLWHILILLGLLLHHVPSWVSLILLQELIGRGLNLVSFYGRGGGTGYEFPSGGRSST